MFAKKQPGQLRERLANLKRDVKLQKIPEGVFNQQAVEILTALKKLGDEVCTLSPPHRLGIWWIDKECCFVFTAQTR